MLKALVFLLLLCFFVRFFVLNMPWWMFGTHGMHGMHVLGAKKSL